MKLELYKIDQQSGQITIRLNQKRNATVNMVISLALIVLGLWLLLTSNEPSFFYYVLLAVGTLWLMASTAGFRKERSCRLESIIAVFLKLNLKARTYTSKVLKTRRSVYKRKANLINNDENAA